MCQHFYQICLYQTCLGLRNLAWCEADPESTSVRGQRSTTTRRSWPKIAGPGLLSDCKVNKTVEDQDKPGSKGLPSPLAPFDCPDQPGTPSNPLSNPLTSAPSFPSLENLLPVLPSIEETSLAESIRPLTSTGLFSPPSHLPPVTLPPYPPFSPIPCDLSSTVPNENSPGIPYAGQNQLLNRELQFSSVGAWVDRLAVASEAEWDNYNSSPTFNRDNQFWNSRARLSTTDPCFLSGGDSSSEENSPEVRKVELVDTVLSDFDTVPGVQNPPTTPNMSAVGQPGPDQLAIYRHNLVQLRNQLNYKMKVFTVEDVDPDDLPLAHEKVKEVNDLFCSVWCLIDCIVGGHASELGTEAVTSLEDIVGTTKSTVKEYEKRIRAKVKSMSSTAPSARPPSSFELESLDIQRKLMEIELNKEKREAKESKVMVSTKAAQVREKLRKLEDCIKLVETRNDRNYWKTVDDVIINRSMKDISKWDLLISAADERFLEFQQLYQLHGDPPDADDTGYNYAAIKDLLCEMRVDLVDAKAAVQAEDKKRSLFSLETTKG